MTEQLIAAFPHKPVSNCCQVLETAFCVNDAVAGAPIQVLPETRGMLNVKAPEQGPWTVLAIDKCLFQDADHPGKGRCEGAIWDTTRFCFFEIKDSKIKNRTDRRKAAHRQLADSIALFQRENVSFATHELEALVVFAAKEGGNSHPATKVDTQAAKEIFWDKYQATLREGNEYPHPDTPTSPQPH